MRHTKLRYVVPAVAAALVAVVAAVAWMRSGPADEAAGDGDAEGPGARVFADTSCGSCHWTDRTETKIGPGLKGLLKGDSVLRNGKPVTRETVREQIVDPYDSMPSYEERLTDRELEHLLDYLETL